MNWYPWDVSYMNRGRCLPYVQLNGACEPQFEGDDAWNQKALPRKANGEFFERPVLCAPELICTGETIHVLPSTCVKRRLPEAGCMSSAPFCAGRSPGDCPSSTKDMCVCPRLVNESAFEKNQSSCTQENKVPVAVAQRLRELGMAQAHYFSKALCGTLIFQQAALRRLPIHLPDFSMQTVFRLSTAGFPLPVGGELVEPFDDSGGRSPASSGIFQAEQGLTSWAADMAAAFCRFLHSLNSDTGNDEEKPNEKNTLIFFTSCPASLTESNPLHSIQPWLTPLDFFTWVLPLQDLLVDCKTPMSNERTVLRWFRSAVMMLSVSAFLTSTPGFASQAWMQGRFWLLC
eukprot:g1497.t3